MKVSISVIECVMCLEQTGLVKSDLFISLLECMNFLMDEHSLENLKKHKNLKYLRVIDGMSYNQHGVWSILDDFTSVKHNNLVDSDEKLQDTISKKLNDSMLERIFDKQL